MSRGNPILISRVCDVTGANYHLPIMYPDFGFADIFYLLRVRGNAFYDYSRIKEYQDRVCIMN